MPSEHDKLLITDYKAGAAEALELGRKAIRHADKALDNGQIRDPGRLAQNAAIASGVLLDKARVLAGEPTEIVGHVDPKQAALQLARRLGVVLDSTATELPPLPELPAA